MADIYNTIQAIENITEKRKAIKDLTDAEKSAYIKYQKYVYKNKPKTDAKRSKIEDPIIASEEQAIILDHMKSGHNCVCNSVAGAGKTTTVMMLAQNNPNTKIHMVTYNSMLKEEVRKKAKKYSNLTVHNYHSLAKVTYIKHHNDYDHNTVFENILTNRLNPIKQVSIDIIVIDETQDMELIFFKFLQKFIKDIGNPNLQYLIMGDNNQAVYDFKGSDARFLTLAENIWQVPMMNTSLTTSYRITNQIASFVNEVMLNKPSFITANKDGPSIQFIIEENVGKKYTVAKYISTYLIDLITNGSIKADDVEVLVASLKGNDVSVKPYQCLEHMLVNAGIDCYVSNKEDSNKKSVTRGKVIFTTFHQSKGGERPIVIVYDFNNEYFSFYNKRKPDNVCCSELYVATTRASQELIVIQFGKPLKFLNMQKLMSASYIVFPFMKPDEIQHDDKKNNKIEKADRNFMQLNPTEMIKYLPEDIKNICAAAIVDLFKSLNGPSDKSFRLPTTMKRKNNLEEDICDLLGLAIPAMFQKNKLGCQSEIERFCEMKINNNKGQSHDIRNKFYNTHHNDDPYLFKTANLYSCIKDNVNNRLRQIDDYNWLPEKQIQICLDHLNAYVGYCEFEKYIGNEDSSKNMNFYEYLIDRLGNDFTQKYMFGGTIQLHGIVDAIDDDIIWEFKCVNELNLEHKLQVVLYAFIWNMFHKADDGPRKFRLLNIVNGDVLELDMTSNKFDEVVCALLRHKIETRDAVSDELFIQSCSQLP
jgi:nucleoside-triphosphatase THEP1